MANRPVFSEAPSQALLEAAQKLDEWAEYNRDCMTSLEVLSEIFLLLGIGSTSPKNPPVQR
jgi:hypothetical protein